VNEFLIAGILFGLLIPGFWLIATANRFTRLERLIEESWANIEVALKRRHDLIPNLVEVVRAYAAHEIEVLDRLAHSRERAISGGVTDEAELGRSVRAVMVVVESYPELRASENYMELQHELANSEDRIAAARRFYNSNVRDFNVLVSSFPSRLLAGKRRLRDFFDAEGSQSREPSNG
jgi:LemA protein